MCFIDLLILIWRLICKTVFQLPKVSLNGPAIVKHPGGYKRSNTACLIGLKKTNQKKTILKSNGHCTFRSFHGAKAAPMHILCSLHSLFSATDESASTASSSVYPVMQRMLSTYQCIITI